LSSITGTFAYVDVVGEGIIIFIDSELVSSVTGIGNQASSNFLSTTKGLGSSGYLSTLGGGGAGAIDYVSAFTISTSYLEVSTISTFALFSYGIINSQMVNPGPDPFGLFTATNGSLDSLGNWYMSASNDFFISSGLSTIWTPTSFYLETLNDARLKVNSNFIIDSERVTLSNLFCENTISTYTLSVYGPNTLVVDGTSLFRSTATIDAILTNRQRFVVSTLGVEDMFITYQDISTKFILTFSNSPQKITLPDVATCGNGWNTLINNNINNGFYTLEIYDSASNLVASNIGPGLSITMITDGSNWFFY
jgi:hypothetical protein